MTWSEVDDNSISFSNSRAKILSVDIEHLIQASKILRENIVVSENELELRITPELVRKIGKLMHVIYMKNGGTSSFVNIHKFIFTPGIIALYIYYRIILHFTTVI